MSFQRKAQNTDAVIERLREVATPLATTDPLAPLSDLTPLVPSLARADVVGLGEATHGTREFFELKHRLTKLLVTELGFTVFGLEASFPECLRINDFVMGADVDPQHALAGQRFWTWDTTEVLALMHWLRTYNEGVEEPRRVRFYGFDMQSPAEAAIGVVAYLNDVDRRLATRLEGPIAPLMIDTTAFGYADLPKLEQAAARRAISTAARALDDNAQLYRRRSSRRDLAIARMHVGVLAQAEINARGATGYAHRDPCMAKNVLAIASLDGNRRKVIAWAHNGHVCRSSWRMDRRTMRTMGQCLHEEIGTRYATVGFAFGSGQFQAIHSERRKLSVHTAPRPHRDTLDGVLSVVGPLFALDMRPLWTDDTVGPYLAETPQTKSIGALYGRQWGEQFHGFGPAHLYDVLVFVNRTRAAQSVRPRGKVFRPQHTDSKPRTHARPVRFNLKRLGVSGLPPGWNLQPVRRPARHTLRSTSNAVVLRVDSAGSRWQSASIGQQFSARPFACGKICVETNAHVEGKPIVSGGFVVLSAFARPHKGQQKRLLQAMVAMPTTTGAPATLRAIVPQDASMIRLAVVVFGDATLHLSDVAITHQD